MAGFRYMIRWLVLTALVIPWALIRAEGRDGITLGATLPLSGNLASYGERIQQGLVLAQEDLAASGVPLQLYAEDTPMSGAGVFSALRSLREKGAIALVGNFSNVAMLGMAPALRRGRMLAMHTAAMDDEILQASQGWIFSTNTRVRDEAFQAAAYARKQLHASRAAVISINTNFGEAYRRHYREAFLELGGEIVADETYELGETDYRTQLARVHAAKPDVLYAATFGHFLGITLRQAREQRLDVPVLSVYESEDPSVIETAGKAANGLRYFVSYDPRFSGAREQFRRRFVDRFHDEPRTFSLNAYDAAQLLARALSACQGNSECTRDAMFKVRDYHGMSGLLSIEPDGSAKKEFFLREVRQGRFFTVPSF